MDMWSAKRVSLDTNDVLTDMMRMWQGGANASRLTSRSTTSTSRTRCPPADHLPLHAR